LTISGRNYALRPIPCDPEAASVVYRLRKSDGTTYHVAKTQHGLTCECGDFEFRKNGTGVPCKHIAAAVAVGLMTR
jgi:hypothetical protein